MGDNKVSEKAVGQEVLKSLSPSQQVIKIVNEDTRVFVIKPFGKRYEDVCEAVL